MTEQGQCAEPLYHYGEGRPRGVTMEFGAAERQQAARNIDAFAAYLGGKAASADDVMARAAEQLHCRASAAEGKSVADHLADAQHSVAPASGTRGDPATRGASVW
ncbi:hypothetical protein [Sphingomonas ginsenosidimutans]|uniref:hypothetical protein n=1 Tax=Sphingomonas ginsenosidimutans TaxID=862134 RepID=UPI001D346449|nr:hypothetical protein [Sphingomonas ginsenosidimutans]MBY0301238.1 hypothetical protein [Sphingomonas ginsenosidimutans]